MLRTNSSPAIFGNDKTKRAKGCCYNEVKNEQARRIRGEEIHKDVEDGERDCDAASSSSSSDNYQVFKICQDRCQRLVVNVLRGKGITRGRIKDWLYSPDPYVTVQVVGTPNGQKRTKHVHSCSDPEWNESIVFYIDSYRDRLVEFVLYDLNRTVNDEIGREIFDINGMEMDVDHNIVISYKNGSKIEAQIRIETNPEPDLRFDLGLCQEEQEFLKMRRQNVLKGLQRLLGEKRAPTTIDEVPTVSLLTSGGGFRAMIAYAGAYRALADSGVMDGVTYTASLSGSSWFLSTLYSHPDFPHDPSVASKICGEIRACVEKHWQVHLSPPWSSRYLRKIIAKSVNGQPVSFTDFYGYLVGQQLLKGRMKARLSDQQEKISGGIAPMPLYTCLHVKSNVSAKVFQEWYEFSPYEVGIPKYGVFLRTSDFASKFYMGQKVRSFPEVPLHFLYGVWGSAFTILFKRLVQERGRNGQSEILRLILGGREEQEEQEQRQQAGQRREQRRRRRRIENHEDEDEDDEELIVRCIAEDYCSPPFSPKEKNLDGEEIFFAEPARSDTEDDEEVNTPSSTVPVSATSETAQEALDVASSDSGFNSSFSSMTCCSNSSSEAGGEGRASQSNNISSDDALDEGQEDEGGEIAPPKSKAAKDMEEESNKGNLLRKSIKQTLKKYNIAKIRRKNEHQQQQQQQQQAAKCPDGNDTGQQKSSPPAAPATRTLPSTASFDRISALEEDRSKWDRVLERALMTTPLDSRAFRAGVILNPLRGLTAEENVRGSNISSPVKPTDRSDCDFKGYRESMKTDDKKIYLVDSGLSFNLPFPPMLRPQRGIQLYITMDFSSRQSDSTPPFRELLLAEKWARLHNIPFPQIRDRAKDFLDKPIQECYIFKDADDDDCAIGQTTPVVIFFPLVNRDFRHLRAPGVPRQTDDEKLFGDFKIFDDTKDYAIWRFVYPNLSFDRLTAMMEFNILNNLETIKDEIAEIVEKKKRRKCNV